VTRWAPLGGVGVVRVRPSRCSGRDDYRDPAGLPSIADNTGWLSEQQGSGSPVLTGFPTAHFAAQRVQLLREELVPGR
jgi:hypothetical protein